MTKPTNKAKIVFDTTVSRIPTEPLKIKGPIAHRDGADDHTRINSLQNGESVPRTPPASISSKVPEGLRYR